MPEVGDLARSVDSCTGVLGMRVQPTTDRPDQRTTLAFVAYGLESRAAVLELA